MKMKRIKRIKSKIKEKAQRAYVYRTRWHFLVMMLILVPFLYIWLTYPSESNVKITGTLFILFALLIVFLEASRRLPFYQVGS